MEFKVGDIVSLPDAREGFPKEGWILTKVSVADNECEIEHALVPPPTFGDKKWHTALDHINRPRITRRTDV